MAPKNAAPEQCKNPNVAGFSLEFERVDDGQGAKRQNCELECENGGEEATADGNEPVVETMAQDRSPLDREVQHERSGCHQRTSTQLSRTCCQNGPLRDLCEGLEVSRTAVVEMATAPLERSGEGQMVWSAPKTTQNLQVGGHGVDRGLQVYWKRRWFCGISSNVHGLTATCPRSWALETICKNVERVLSCCSQCGCTMEIHQMPRGPRCARHAGGILSLDGVDWRWLASIGFDRRRTFIGRMKEMRRERGLASTWHPSLCIEPGLLLICCSHGTMLDMVGR